MISEPVSETRYFIKKLDDGQRQKTEVRVMECNCVFHMVLRARSVFFSPVHHQPTVVIVQLEFVRSEERNESNLDYRLPLTFHWSSVGAGMHPEGPVTCQFVLDFPWFSSLLHNYSIGPKFYALLYTSYSAIPKWVEKFPPENIPANIITYMVIMTTYLLNYSMLEGPCWEANRFSEVTMSNPKVFFPSSIRKSLICLQPAFTERTRWLCFVTESYIFYSNVMDCGVLQSFFFFLQNIILITLHLPWSKLSLICPITFPNVFPSTVPYVSRSTTCNGAGLHSHPTAFHKCWLCLNPPPQPLYFIVQ